MQVNLFQRDCTASTGMVRVICERSLMTSGKP